MHKIEAILKPIFGIYAFEFNLEKSTFPSINFDDPAYKPTIIKKLSEK